MKVVAIKTMKRDRLSDSLAPADRWIYKHEIYTVEVIDVVAGKLVYFFVEIPENTSYLAENFVPLSKMEDDEEFLASISIEELLEEPQLEIRLTTTL